MVYTVFTPSSPLLLWFRWPQLYLPCRLSFSLRDKLLLFRGRRLLCTGAHLGSPSRSSVSCTHPQFSRLRISSDKAAVKLGAPLP